MNTAKYKTERCILKCNYRHIDICKDCEDFEGKKIVDADKKDYHICFDGLEHQNCRIGCCKGGDYGKSM